MQQSPFQTTITTVIQKMSSNAYRERTAPSAMTTVVSPHHPTLVLRRRVEDIRNQFSSDVENLSKSSKLKSKKSSRDELFAEVDAQWEKFKKNFVSKADQMKEEVKSHTPKQPMRKNFQTDKDFDVAMQKYESELDDYRTLIATCSYILDRLGKVLEDCLEKYKTYLGELWKRIQDQPPEEVEKFASNFNSKTQLEIIQEVDYLLGLKNDKPSSEPEPNKHDTMREPMDS